MKMRPVASRRLGRVVVASLHSIECRPSPLHSVVGVVSKLWPPTFKRIRASASRGGIVSVLVCGREGG